MADGAQDQFFAQVSESIKDLHDLTTRVDERVKHLIEKQSDMEQKMNRIDGLSERMAVMESKAGAIDTMATDISNIEQNVQFDEKRLSTLESSNQSLQSRWQQIGSFVVQLAWAVIACYIIYKLGLSDALPPSP